MAKSFILTLCFLLTGVTAWAQSPATQAPASNQTATTPATEDAVGVRQEIDQLKLTIAALEKRLEAQEKQKLVQAGPGTETEARIDELDTTRAYC